MAMITIPQIVDRLQKLPPEKLLVVYDFVSYLEERTSSRVLKSIFRLE
jgi:predicted AAA+ superfamily ATPase